MLARAVLAVLTIVAAVAALLVAPVLAPAHPATLDGVVRALAADTVAGAPGPRFTGRSEDVYRQVLVSNGKAYFLKGARLRPNTRVRVSGDVVGNELTVSSVDTVGTTSGIPPSGTTRVLVLLAYWTAADTVTPDRARSQLFSDSNAWYREGSFQALGQTGDVTPWMRIAPPATGCYADHLTLMEEAKAAAQALGYDLSAYANFVLYFPYCGGDSAGYAGWAYVGSQGTWLNGYMDRRVTVHEQGHNYGLWHSHSYLCDGGGLSGSCSFSDYGDDYDAMGASGYVGHFNGSQKTLLGWMGGRTADLSNGGTATLAPMATGSTSPHAAVIRMSSGRAYWLEYRQAIGFDAGLPAGGTDGVLVHVAGPGSGSPDSGASLIDVRPADGVSVYSATVRPGESWTSPDGVTIAVTGVSATGAAVSVRTPAAATLTVTRAGTGTGTVTSSPAGIACGATCSAPFANGSTVTLTAAPASGSTFTSWSGACAGTAPTCTVTLSAATTVGASFGSANLVRNPSFETDLSGWGGYQGTITRVAAAGAPDGSFVAKADWSTGTVFSLSDASGGAYPTVSSTVAGGVYVATAYVKAATTSSIGKPVQIFLRERNAAGTTVRDTGTSGTLGSGWTRLGVAASAAAAGDTLGLRITQNSAASGNGFYADLLTLRRGTAVLGDTVAGTVWTNATANAKRVSQFTLNPASTVDLGEIRAYLDGRAATTGSQPVRAVVYADASGAPGALLGRTNEVSVVAGRAAGWVPLKFASLLRLGGGTYWLGLHTGGSIPVARFAATAAVGGLRFNDDPYGDGSSNPFGTPGTSDKRLSIYAVGG